MESVAKDMVHVKKENAVPNMDGVEQQMTIVVMDVNPNLENVNQQLPLLLHQLNLIFQPKHHLMENVAKNMVHVKKENAVLNTDGVERQMTIVVMDVNLNLVFVIIKMIQPPVIQHLLIQHLLTQHLIFQHLLIL